MLASKVRLRETNMSGGFEAPIAPTLTACMLHHSLCVRIVDVGEKTVTVETQAEDRVRQVI